MTPRCSSVSSVRSPPRPFPSSPYRSFARRTTPSSTSCSSCALSRVSRRRSREESVGSSMSRASASLSKTECGSFRLVQCTTDTFDSDEAPAYRCRPNDWSQGTGYSPCSRRTARSRRGDMAHRNFKVLDSDIHIIEPPDLWQRYIDPAFRDRAPHGMTEDAGDLRLGFDGTPWGRVVVDADRSRRRQGHDYARNQERWTPFQE